MKVKVYLKNNLENPYIHECIWSMVFDIDISEMCVLKIKEMTYSKNGKIASWNQFTYFMEDVDHVLIEN